MTADAAAADPGLFGPRSITWRVHSDPVLWVGGLRALFLQAVHPLAMAGVAQHSDFRGDPWGRLRRTADYVGTITYGTTVDAKAAGARVRRLHRGLAGIEPESGRTYHVDDPVLLRWVHCCEVDSFLSTYRRSGGRLTPAEADRYLEEQARLAAPLVGLHREDIPASTAELSAYFRAMRPELHVTRLARRTALFVLVPPMPRWVELLTPARAGWAGISGLSFALLPRWARRLYRLPGLPSSDLAAGIAVRALGTGLRALPPHLRDGPHLKAARRRLVLPELSIRRLAALPTGG